MPSYRLPSFLLLLFLLAAAFVAGAQALDPAAYGNPNGNTRVVVSADATQSYELYIPPGAQAPYAMVYGSVQTGLGKSLLLLLAEAAAEQGWAVAVSNNTTNYLVAQDSVLGDTEARLSLHPTRRFATGFSGAGREAMIMAARYPEKITGVLMMGAGDAESGWYPVNPDIATFILIGRSDSNFSYDITRTQFFLLTNGYRCFVQPYNGGHVWPSKSFVRQGMQYLADYAGSGAGVNREECAPEAAFDHGPGLPYTPGYESQWNGDWSAYQKLGPVRGKVTALTWWGVSQRYSAVTEEYSPCLRTTESFRVSFFLEEEGVPGNATIAVTVTPERVYTGVAWYGYEVYRYRYEFPEPVDVGEAAWLRVAAMPASDGCTWTWLGYPEAEPPGLRLYLPDYGQPDAFQPTNYGLAVCMETDAPALEGEGTAEGEGAAEGIAEGTPEGVADGEGTGPDIHTADINADQVISLSELLRVVQLFSYGGYHCAPVDAPTEDGLAMGDNSAAHACAGCSADYAPKDWNIDLGELLRLVQLYNSITGYGPCISGEDGFCLL